MAASYVFTVDDQMNPVYCLGCRAHIPKHISNQGKGHCPTCLALQAQAQQAQAQAQQLQAQQAQAAAQAAHQAIYNHATGLGRCPQCSSPNIVEAPTRQANGAKNGLSGAGLVLMLIGALTFCLGGGFLFIVGLILLIVGCCLPGDRVVSVSRYCNACGYRWQV